MNRVLQQVWKPATVTASMFLMLVASAYAQDSQFFFDLNGNLQAQAGEGLAPPQIIGQPQNQVAEPGDAVSFSVVAADTRDMIYQWRFNGADINGAIAPTLLVRNVVVTNEGQYSVVLLNSAGSVTSTPAMLWYDGNRNSLPDSWELAYFGSLTNHTVEGDNDGDGVSNLQEFLDGTNPTNAASANYRLIVVNDGGSVSISPNQSSYAKGEVVILTAIPAENFHAWTGDALSHSNVITVTMGTNKTIYARFTPVTFTWTNSVGGDWNYATNWLPNLVPGTNDIALVTSTITITNDSTIEAGHVVFGAGVAGPTLTGAGTFTMYGTSVWNSVTLNGNGRTVVAPGGVLNLASIGSVYITSRVFENGGTVRWTGSGPLVLFSGVTITNRPSAIFDAKNAASIAYGSGTASHFDNAGIFRKSTNSATTTIGTGVPFNNYGTIDLQTGTLLLSDVFLNQGNVSLSPGATNRSTAGGSATGSFFTSSNSLVEWAGGAFTLNPGTQLNGPGLYRISASTLTCSTDLTVQNLDLAATLTGPGNVTLNGMMNWNGILSGSGRIMIAAGALLNVTNFGSVYLTTRVLENAGTMLWTAASPIVIGSGAVITNRVGGLIDAQSGGTLLYGGGGGCRLDNAGTFRKSVGAARTWLTAGVALNNYGWLDLQAGLLLCDDVLLNNGSLTLSAGATNRVTAGGSANGNFSAASGSVVEWSGGVYTLNPGAQLNGPGAYRVTAGTLSSGADLSVANLDLSSTLNGSGTVTITSLMNWNGTMSGSGRTIVAPAATLTTSNGAFLTSRVLENGGSIFWTGSGYLLLTSGAVITNRPGALFNVQNAAPFLYGGGSGSRLDNAGIFRKSLSTGTTRFDAGITVFNYGIVDLRGGIVAANGGYTSSSGALLNCAIGGTIPGTNYGQLQIAGAATLSGALSVDLTNGFLPTTNDSFTVLAAGSRSGAFSSFSYPSNQVTMQLSNTPTSVIVAVTAVATGPPTLLVPTLSGSNILLSWTATSNVTYRLEFNPDLGQSNWNALPGDVTSPSNIASKLDPLTPSNRFYRVRVLP